MDGSGVCVGSGVESGAVSEVGAVSGSSALAAGMSHTNTLNIISTVRKTAATALANLFFTMRLLVRNDGRTEYQFGYYIL
jgi:hypothetical protein